MSRAEIHAELRATRPWVLLMGFLALLLLACWAVFAAMGTLALLNPEVTAEWTPYLRGLLLGLVVQIGLVALWGLVPFLHLVRFGLLLDELDGANPALLHRALELNRRFWAQAEVMAWGVAWVTVYYVVGGILGVLNGWLTPAA
jgi:hypothetical protein